MRASALISRVGVILLSSLSNKPHPDFWNCTLGFWCNHALGGIENRTVVDDPTIVEAEESSGNGITSPASTCHDPCATLSVSVTRGMVLVPLGLALLFLAAGAFQMLAVQGRRRAEGVRGCLAVLLRLWVHVLLAFLYWFEHDRAQAYAWALHSSVYLLSVWQPRAVPQLGMLTCWAGVAGVCVFAWQFGPPIGLAAWNRSGDALCGWRVHLVAMVGVELVELGAGLAQGVVGLLCGV